MTVHRSPARLAGGVVLLILQLQVPAVEIVAHRGASAEAPENTLASVQLAWNLGADAVEVDVFLTRDGKIVAIHDRTAKRTAGVDWPIAERTLAELRSLDAGRWKGARWKGEKIPTLEEVLATIPRGKRMLVEVKCGAEILPHLARTLRSSGREAEQIAIIGFGLDTMREAKTACPTHKVYWVSGWKKDKQTGEWVTRIEDLISRAAESGVDGLDLSADGPLDEDAVRKVRDADLELHVWTVNDVDVARRMMSLGVDSITTDRPGWLRTRLKAK